jgi:4-amino-4-deoxy-L-arabinose transferase-like glycosyltransferase
VALLGVRESAFRLPSALCAAIWAWLIFAFARRRYGIRTGLVAAVVMATSIAVCVVGRMATADGLLNMLIAATMFSAWLHLETGEKRWLYGSFAAAGLGFLAKGPVAVFIPAAATLLFYVLRRDLRSWLKTAFDPAGLAVFAAIALPWYAYTLYQDGGGFLQGFFMKHNVARFSAPMQGHSGGPAYYLPVLLIATLPHTALLAAVVSRWREVWREELQLFLVLWLAVVFVAFSASGTKLPHYLVYGMSGVFILMAVHGTRMRSHVLALLPALVLFGALLALPSLVDWGRSRSADPEVRDLLADVGLQFGWDYYALLGSAALVTVWLFVEPLMDLSSKIAIAGIAAAVVVSAVLFPIAGAALQDPVKQAGILARDNGYSVVAWGINAPTFSVYYGRPTPNAQPRPGDVVLTKRKRLADLRWGYETLYQRREVVLVRVSG